jgi:hypothetical protein
MGNKGRAAESRPACDGRDGERHCHPRSRRGGGRDRVSGHLWWWCSRPSCTSLSLDLMAAEYSRSSNRCPSRSRSRLQRRPDHQSQHVLSSPSATEPPGRTAGNTLYTATRRYGHPLCTRHPLTITTLWTPMGGSVADFQAHARGEGPYTSARAGWPAADPLLGRGHDKMPAVSLWDRWRNRRCALSRVTGFTACTAHARKAHMRVALMYIYRKMENSFQQLTAQPISSLG